MRGWLAFWVFIVGWLATGMFVVMTDPPFDTLGDIKENRNIKIVCLIPVMFVVGMHNVITFIIQEVKNGWEK